MDSAGNLEVKASPNITIILRLLLLLRRARGLYLNHQSPRDHNLSHISAAQNTPFLFNTPTELFSIDENDVQRLVRPGKCADENSAIGYSDTYSLA